MVYILNQIQSLLLVSDTLISVYSHLVIYTEAETACQKWGGLDGLSDIHSEYIRHRLLRSS